jgi:DNA polymerase-3 subunit alpha
LELLRQNAEGVIALSGGLGGEVAQHILRRDHSRALAAAQTYKSIFGERFYLEVQPTVVSEHQLVKEAMRELCREAGVSPVAAGDVHYLEPSEAELHKVLMCMQMQKSVSDADGLARVPTGYHLRTPDEMRQAFADWPEAYDNAIAIAEACSADLELGQVFLPNYRVPEGFADQATYLTHLAHERLSRRLQKFAELGQAVDEAHYRQRLDFELGVIAQMGFPGYFLIVWDFINWGKENGVPVGPGRGSGAGSLVAYSLGITDIDPIRYDLLFERFLNPERVSMPDFDIDFCMNKRDRVIEYVTQKYGAENVGQIVTFGTLKARGVIRDVARVMDLSFGDADKIAKLVPEVLNITLDEARAQEPRLQELLNESELYSRLFETARGLENLNRHTGVHAAGIVIGEEPLEYYVPVLYGDSGELITQFAKNEVEEAGLVKFDFLGLKTLTVLDNAVGLIRSGANPSFDLDAIPMDDAKTFKLLQSGNTTGVFQLESSGFKDLMRKLKPDKFEDIIAAVALYRPGPLQSGMVDSFIRRKHGLEPVEYLHPALRDVLSETYGTIIYQEQVMRLASTLAGFSLGQADILRRAMGKKKADVMAQQREVFVKGCEERGTSEAVAGPIFDLVQEFASYGFNKSHSAAYGLISYQTAYLKAHYPVEFMAALLTCDKDNTSKVVRYINEARAMGISIRPPDVNASQMDFSVSEGAIRFGLGGVKNVGEGAVQNVIEARSDGAAFRSLFEFAERVDLRKVNRRVFEGLVKCGAFDSFGQPRDVLAAHIEQAMERGQQMQRDKASGQMSLFGALLGGPAPKRAEGHRALAAEEHWSERQRLAFERDTLGFYITGHPLDQYAGELERHRVLTTADLESADNHSEVVLAGVVAGLRERVLKDGSGRMGFVQLEDRSGTVECVCFSSVYATAEPLLKSDSPLVLRGRVRVEGDEENAARTVRVEEVLSLADLRQKLTRRVEIHVAAKALDAALLAALQDTLRQHAGPCKLLLRLDVDPAAEALIACGTGWSVSPTDDLVTQVERLVGPKSILFG